MALTARSTPTGRRAMADLLPHVIGPATRSAGPEWAVGSPRVSGPSSPGKAYGTPPRMNSSSRAGSQPGGAGERAAPPGGAW